MRADGCSLVISWRTGAIRSAGFDPPAVKCRVALSEDAVTSRGNLFILEYSRATNTTMSYALPGRVLEQAVR